MTYHALSLGAGVNSTALLLLLVAEKFPLDEVVFADTGSELPETYDYLHNQIAPFLKEKGIPLAIVEAKRKVRFEPLGMSLEVPNPLEERCWRAHAVPDMRYRWSTRDHKIRPINRHLKPKAPVILYIGIAKDEAERVKGETQEKWIRRSWPLIDHGLGREDCEKLIAAHHWPIPPKSGCWFCPFQKLSQWKSLLDKHPELYARAIALEKNGSKYPEFGLRPGTTLEQLQKRFAREDKAIKEQVSLDECEGFCFT